MHFLRDLRFARRSLLRTPVVSAAAVVSIALGIAATTAVFSVVDTALFRQPPFERAHRLVMLYVTRRDGDAAASEERWSWPRSVLLRERAASFEAVASFTTSVLALTSDAADPEPVKADMISSDYWRVLRVNPVAGRVFGQEVDEGAGAQPEIVLAYDLWQRRFGGDRSIVGRMVGVNGVALRVIGIAPRDFRGLSGRAQAWIPATMAPVLSYADYLTTNQNFISVVGRLRGGVSIAQANAELAVLSDVIQHRAPSAGARPSTRFGATAMSLNAARVDPGTRRPLMLLLAAAATLLVLACANVTGLLLGRAVSRQREIAIRVAIGAGRRRLVTELLAESSLLAAAGGVLGVLVALPLASNVMLPSAAAHGSNFYGALGEFGTPRADLRVIAFCFAACAATAVAFGLFPAWRASRVDPNRDLRDGSGVGTSARRGQARQLIIAGETAIAVLLLVAGGLLASSWRRLTETNVGFDR